MMKLVKNLSGFEKMLWLSSVLLLTVTFLVTKNNDWLMLTASLVGLTALIFVAKGDALGQLLTIVFSVLYAFISYRFRYFGEMITYLGMTAPIAFLSLITWLYHPYADREVKVNHLRIRSWIVLNLSTGIVTYGFYYILSAFGTPNIVFSTISITTSFMASALMMLRSPYYAIAYAANDIVLIILWILASMSDIKYIPMVLCFVIFLISDIYGFLSWKSMKIRQQQELNLLHYRTEE